METIEIKGYVKAIQTKNGVSKKGEAWNASTLVIVTDDKYDNEIPVDFFNPNFSVKQGDTVVATVQVGGSEWNGRWFVKLKGQNLAVVNAGRQQSTSPAPQAPQPQRQQYATAPVESDDVPF
jgi:exosome complex RNA-binding protein Csl4